MGNETWVVLGLAAIAGVYKLSRDDPRLVLKLDSVTTYLQAAAYIASATALLILPVVETSITSKLRAWQPTPDAAAIRAALSSIDTVSTGAWWVLWGSFIISVLLSAGAFMAKRRLAELAKDPKIIDKTRAE